MTGKAKWQRSLPELGIMSEGQYPEPSGSEALPHSSVEQDAGS